MVKAFASHASCTQAHVRSPGARTRLTPPATFSETSNRVPASAGIKAGTSPLSGGR